MLDKYNKIISLPEFHDDELNTVDKCIDPKYKEKIPLILQKRCPSSSFAPPGFPPLYDLHSVDKTMVFPQRVIGQSSTNQEQKDE